MNARFSHAAFGLRCLRASLGPLRDRCMLLEATVQERPLDLVERILAARPRIVGLSVFIWNVAPLTEVVRLLKAVAPDVQVVLGGPEVSHETAHQPIVQAADYVVRGEGEEAFAKLCKALLTGLPPADRVLDGGSPDLAALTLPYGEYTDEDLAHRVLYVEASRGCPFSCQFCLSALDERVRMFDEERLFAAFEDLLARGATVFKFIDRTFNLKLRFAEAILRFFLERHRPGLFVHFEMVPDRLPDSLRGLLAAFPEGAVQLEVGIQTFDPDVQSRIERRQDLAKTEDNIRFLVERSGVHVHTDLIVGLPGEDLDTFAQGFDRLFAWGPHEIQVGILKRLNGAPIGVHTDAFAMVYSPGPPYEILRNDRLSFDELSFMRHFARLFDRLYNQGHLLATSRALLTPAPFARMAGFTRRVLDDHGTSHHLALSALAGHAFAALVDDGLAPQDAAALVMQDLTRDKPRAVPQAIAAHPRVEVAALPAHVPAPDVAHALPRQARHLAGARASRSGAIPDRAR